MVVSKHACQPCRVECDEVIPRDVFLHSHLGIKGMAALFTHFRLNVDANNRSLKGLQDNVIIN